MIIKQIKIDFFVTPQIKRYVFVYLIDTGKTLLMIDSGVAGSENIIENAIKSIGYQPSDLEAIFLTHAHPDHIGTACYFREKYGAKVFASKGERAWIEDINLQYSKRPIPNFFELAGKSTPVDYVVKDGDKVFLSDRSVIEVVGTSGHSVDEVSFRYGDALFIGDSVPVKGDIPILVDLEKSIKTLEIIAGMTEVTRFYPAWDQEYSREMMDEKISEAKRLIDILRTTVKKADNKYDLPELVEFVCEELKMPILKSNPLFAKTIEACRKEGEECFASKEYQEIMNKRISSVDARALIVEN
ncbi:MAG: MBL fold metallo-hydrolase [Lachnospiraceae bacterium]|nr:MBL fold metallo-hydrolase [Lachnospiraceae bacterium]